MYAQETAAVECPSCGERIELLIDTSLEQQEYIEDCSVCCRPIVVTVRLGHGRDLEVRVRDENSC
ncbi:MAG: CPXCG motif-containing cysteine-rich protein [Gammaproteobacteria bacterium]|jgi:hypothetical protein